MFVHICLLALHLVSSYCEESEVISLVWIYRHGDRTPINPYPTDPYRDPSYWPVDFGQLTNKGKMRHYKLGQWFRQRYATFIPHNYTERDIYVRSSDVDRTLMSAEANLAGLYPPTPSQEWNPALDWAPIPVHTVPELEDPIIAMKKPCDKYTYLYNLMLHSKEMRRIDARIRGLYQYLTEHTGTKIEDVTRVEYLYSDLSIEQQNNYTLPNWTQPVFPMEMRPWAEYSFSLQCRTPEMALLKTGPMFHQILEHFANATSLRNDVLRRKMLVYSGHDVTIANVLMSLGLFEYHSPPVASTIMIELRRRRNDSLHYVNIYYKNETVPLRMTLKGCAFDCPYRQWVGIMRAHALSMREWYQGCQIEFLGLFPLMVMEHVVFFACTSLLLLLGISLILGIFYLKHSERNVYMPLPENA